jgi:hypothetical protein
MWNVLDIRNANDILDEKYPRKKITVGYACGYN